FIPEGNTPINLSKPYSTKKDNIKEANGSLKKARKKERRKTQKNVSKRKTNIVNVMRTISA
ncbi:MAG: hypothetical protein J7K23_05050, partial [Thermoproteales archaeon]|nr:hypothetical protein [Thermoproteales archaeon]